MILTVFKNSFKLPETKECLVIFIKSGNALICLSLLSKTARDLRASNPWFYALNAMFSMIQLQFADFEQIFQLYKCSCNRYLWQCIIFCSAINQWLLPVLSLPNWPLVHSKEQGAISSLPCHPQVRGLGRQDPSLVSQQLFQRRLSPL